MRNLLVSLALVYFNLATTYDAMKNGDKAIEYAQKSLGTARLVLPDTDQMIKDNRDYLAHLGEKFSSSNK